nr:hypothetical protein [Tanacetum cinerariifolium]
GKNPDCQEAPLAQAATRAWPRRAGSENNRPSAAPRGRRLHPRKRRAQPRPAASRPHPQPGPPQSQQGNPAGRAGAAGRAQNPGSTALRPRFVPGIRHGGRRHGPGLDERGR